jgi:hypothetical protein
MVTSFRLSKRRKGDEYKKNVENKRHARRPRHRREEILDWSLKELSGRIRL